MSSGRGKQQISQLNLGRTAGEMIPLPYVFIFYFRKTSGKGDCLGIEEGNNAL